MKKVQIKTKFILIFVLTFNISLIKTSNATLQSYGVEEGQDLEFGVVQRPERPDFTQGMELPGGMDMEDIANLTQVRIDNFTLQPIFDTIPPRNSNFTIRIVSFPNDTNTGRINVSYNMTEYQLTIGNKLGEPIISRDWDLWIQVLDTLASKEYICDKKVELVEYELTNKTLTSTIILKPRVPSSMSLYLTGIKINQTQCYFTETGIQAYMAITTTFSVRIFGHFTSVLFYKYIGSESIAVTNIIVPTYDLDVLQIIIPIIVVVTIINLLIVFIITIRKRLKA